MKVVVADVEGNDLLPGLTKMWCVGIADPKDGKVTIYANQKGYEPLEAGLKILKEADRVVFHNGIGYDFDAINMLYPGTLKLSQIYDTLLMGRYLCPEYKMQGIAAWGERFGYPKGDHSDFSRFSHEMATYCVRDVEITVRLYRILQKRSRAWFDKGIDIRESIRLEHEVLYVIQLQERHGFRLDIPKAQNLELELRSEQLDKEADLQVIFPPKYRPAKAIWDWKERKWVSIETTVPKVNNGPLGRTKGVPFTKVEQQLFNPNSRPQVVQRLTQKYKWRPTKFTPAGQPAVDEEVLSGLPYPEAKELNRMFRLTKQLGQIADGDNAWLKLVKDGYVHGRVNTLGARTHRMSHNSPNMAQVDKKDKRMREVWLPDKGHVLVGCDAEGLELRMLGHYLYRWDGGLFARSVVEGNSAEGTDAHTRNQRLTGLYSRDYAKTLIYAFLYGSGNPNLGMIIIEDAQVAGKPTPKGAPAGIGKRARNALEKGIVGLGELIELVKRRTKDVGYVKGLDGRPLESVSGHSALNTLLQGAGAIVMKLALRIFHYELCVEKGYVCPTTHTTKRFYYCANVHDEVQMSVEEEHAETIGKLFADAIRIAGERLNLKCSLAGAYDIGLNWKETH